MTESKRLTPEEVLNILKEAKTQKIRDKKFPFYVLRIPLYNQYGIDNIRPALINLVRTMQIKMGHTMNDIYFDVAIGGRYREIEDEFLIKCNFKPL